jgi:hypothetical protein
VVSGIGDPRVRWIDAPRTGHQAGPNNEGLRQARGAVVAYLGHDDLWLPHHLTSTLRAIDAGADVTNSLTLAVAPDGRTTMIVPLAPGERMPPSAVVHRRQVAETLGGWRDYRELSIDPETDLWRRAHAAGFRFAVVPRLGVVKFPAAQRRDVYRTRPCHEQAAWLARIRAEPDLEAVELATVAIARAQAPLDGPVRHAVRLAVRPFNPRYWLYQLRTRQGRRIRAAQRFKGIDREQGVR